ncbi:MAG TPA: hypothetical protein VGI61_07385 [Parafilimonas sp.]|jgi:hypothetical protein
MNNRKTFVLFFSLSIAFYSIAASSTRKLFLQRTNGSLHEILNEHAFADSNSLKKALMDYMEKVDSGKYAEIIPYYDSNFLSIRVVDAGQFIKMDYNQMIYFWKMQLSKQTSNSFNHQAIVTQKTTIHYMEILGDTGYVLLTRIKDLGNGPEPIFYNLIWINKNNQWYLLREIVHQRTMPNLH